MFEGDSGEEDDGHHPQLLQQAAAAAASAAAGKASRHSAADADSEPARSRDGEEKEAVVSKNAINLRKRAGSATRGAAAAAASH